MAIHELATMVVIFKPPPNKYCAMRPTITESQKQRYMRTKDYCAESINSTVSIIVVNKVAMHTQGHRVNQTGTANVNTCSTSGDLLY